MNTLEICQFVTRMANEFIRLYNEKFSDNGKYIEDSNILESGYCFYFAKFLLEHIPNSTMYYSREDDHYVIECNDIFYDYSGFRTDYNKDNMHKVRNLLEEEAMSTLTGVIDDEKTRIWNLIINDLEIIANEYLEKKTPVR